MWSEMFDSLLAEYSVSDLAGFIRAVSPGIFRRTSVLAPLRGSSEMSIPEAKPEGFDKIAILFAAGHDTSHSRTGDAQIFVFPLPERSLCMPDAPPFSPCK